MQSLLEFSAIKSCPDLSPDYILLSESLSKSKESSNHLQPLFLYQRLSESEIGSSSHDLQDVTMTTTTQEDTIEILSSQIEQDDEDDDIRSSSSIVPIKSANGEKVDNDPASIHRKRVVRAVGAVTFLLLLFSIILIGISLNMSKEIDELVRQSTLAMRHSQSNYVTGKENQTQFL